MCFFSVVLFGSSNLCFSKQCWRKRVHGLMFSEEEDEDTSFLADYECVGLRKSIC
jgi:hypothetical protein